MKVLLIQIHGTRPNPALMKISAFHKKKADKVFLETPNRWVLGVNPEKVYISCVFSENRGKALGISKMFKCEVELGGSGVDLDKTLPDDIEHIMPDYSIYNIRYSIGFTSRGCNRSCPWCIVPKKEGMIREHAPIDEFYVPNWKKLILYDNNFLASPKWAEKLHELAVRKVKVSFNQGLDIRLVDQEVAKLLSKVRYFDDGFKKRRLYFSFDLPNIESQVIEGIESLNRAGVKPQHLMFYVLVGFSTTFEQDYHRFEVLNNLGVKPYIMLYNDRRDRPLLRHFERWVNRRYYKVVKFDEYKPAKKVLAHAT